MPIQTLENLSKSCQRKFILEIARFQFLEKMNLKFSIFLITSHQFKRGELILGNIEESSEDGTLPDRKTTFSKIKFRPDSADNHATYACEVR